MTGIPGARVQLMVDVPETLRSIPVILNPGARSMRAAGRSAEIRALSGRVDLRETTAAGDARRIASDLARSGASMVVAAGGDGTVNEVLNGIVDAGALESTALGILPTGTMNVLAADLGLPVHDLARCWDVIAGGRERMLDLWSIHDTHFVQLAGAGFDAAVIHGTAWESKKRFGAASYVLSGLRLLRRTLPLITIHPHNGAPLEGVAVVLGNGRRYGGPFRVFPAASHTDGLIDVVVVRRQRFRSLLSLGSSAVTGRPLVHAEITRFQTASLRLESASPIPCQADGEFAGAASPVLVRLAARPLRVLA